MYLAEAERHSKRQERRQDSTAVVVESHWLETGEAKSHTEALRQTHMIRVTRRSQYLYNSIHSSGIVSSSKTEKPVRL